MKARSFICGGWRGGFESWTGDWKERSLSHCFVKRNYQSKKLCDQCNAVQPFAKTRQDEMQFLYTNFALDAPWTRTIRSHDDYLRDTPSLTPWIAVPGFQISRVKWDMAHTILLGAGKDIAASFLLDLAPCYGKPTLLFSSTMVVDTPKLYDSRLQL